MDTNRDDLEAMLRRAAELERANDFLRARNAELEARIAATKTEGELNRTRLAEALAREREEEPAREQARRDEAQRRTLAQVEVARVLRNDARYMVVTLAVVGAIIAGANGSLAAMAIIGAAAVVALLASMYGRSART